MDIGVDAMQIVTDVSECMSIWQIQQATAQDEHLQWIKCFIITGRPDIGEQLYQDIRLYWSIKDDMLVKDGVIMKTRCIVIPKALQQQALDQLHVNHMGMMEKTKLLVHKSVYWVNINSDIENYKNCTTCLTFQQIQPKEKIIHHYVPIIPWDVVGADMFHINNKIISILYTTMANSW